MTPPQIHQAMMLGRCTFPVASFEKRMAHVMYGTALSEPTKELTVKQAAYLDGLSHRYRKQIGCCLSAVCAKLAADDCRPVAGTVLARLVTTARVSTEDKGPRRRIYRPIGFRRDRLRGADPSSRTGERQDPNEPDEGTN